MIAAQCIPSFNSYTYILSSTNLFYIKLVDAVLWVKGEYYFTTRIEINLVELEVRKRTGISGIITSAYPTIHFWRCEKEFFSKHAWDSFRELNHQGVLKISFHYSQFNGFTWNCSHSHPLSPRIVFERTLEEMCFRRRERGKCLSLRCEQVFACFPLGWVHILHLKKVSQFLLDYAVISAWHSLKLHRLDPQVACFFPELHTDKKT